MYCNKCGEKIPENARFCNKCGVEIGVEKKMHCISQQALPKPKKKKRVPYLHIIMGVVFTVILTFSPMYRYYYTLGWDRSRDFYVGIFDMPDYNGLASFFFISWFIIIACVVGYIMFAVFDKNALSLLCWVLIPVIIFIMSRKIYDNQYVLRYSHNFSTAHLHLNVSNYFVALMCVLVTMIGVPIGHILGDATAKIIVSSKRKRAKKKVQ